MTLRRETTTAAPKRIGLAGLAVIVMAMLSLLGCSGSRPTLEPAAAKPKATTAAPTTTSAPVENTDALGPNNLLGYIAAPNGKPEVHEKPSDSSPSIDVPATTENGAPTTFAVVGDPGNSQWLRVALPTRPNDSTGYVKASSVTISHTALRAFVDLEKRTLRVESDKVEVLSAQIAIGTAENPTPKGGSYVTEVIESTEPRGAYGPYAFGLSMHSDTLTEFAGGDGQVGIHGTNQPKLIGEAVSHGCVRLKNDDIKKLLDLGVPLGMPVFVA